ncbi:MAG: hypothetical protein RBS80_28915 [Thermoguttaceae bacterium]|jgi:hypothetical protein|nr:hypothetical protein [Thermoguttaceae bacterium]
MRTDTETRTEGLRALASSLGAVEAERFVTLLLREPFDYTEWRQHLWEGNDAVTLSREAMAARRAAQDAAASQKPETIADQGVERDR